MAGSRLTVLQMLPALEGGGVEQGTLEITAALTRAGHRALVMSAGGRLVADIEAAGGEHIAWPVGAKSLRSLVLVPRLRRLFAAEGVDIVHPRSRVPAWIAWLAWRAARPRPRLVTTVHGFYRPGRYSAVMTRGERVICVSAAIRDYVCAHYPEVPRDRMTLIHRGVDLVRYRPDFRPDPDWQARWSRTLPALAGKQTLLLPARLTRRKGHEDFLRLLAALRDAGRPVHGLVVGGEDPRRGAYAGEIRALADRLGLGADVSFLGHRRDLREVMAVSDLVTSLSVRPESFGRVVAEALALGRPTLGYAHGGVAEILAELYPAGAVPPGDLEALRGAALRLLDAPPPVAPVTTFSLERMQQQTLDLYEELAGEPAPAH